MENEQAKFIRRTFNDEFIKFVGEVYTIFPNDKDIKKAKTALEMLKSANPKLIIKIWKEYISDVYVEKIMQGDISFFIHKDYSSDIAKSGNASTNIMESINRLRQPIRDMGDTNQKIAMHYIQNLTKLCIAYFDTF